MGFIDAILLGTVQGVTEFLPVSSSGHLILMRDILGVSMKGSLAMDVMLHVATLLVVIVYFQKIIVNLVRSGIGIVLGQDVTHKNRMIIYGVVVGTVPAVTVGLLWGDSITELVRNPVWVAGGLILGSILMWLSERVFKHDEELTVPKSIVIGFFQILAFIPGMSRSGATISGGMFAGVSREEAAQFSFLLAIPIIAGAGVQQIFSGAGGELYAVGWVALVGGVSAFIAGLVSVHFLMKFVRSHTLDMFVYYRLALAGIVLFEVFVWDFYPQLLL